MSHSQLQLTTPLSHTQQSTTCLNLPIISSTPSQPNQQLQTFFSQHQQLHFLPQQQHDSQQILPSQSQLPQVNSNLSNQSSTNFILQPTTSQSCSQTRKSSTKTPSNINFKDFEAELDPFDNLSLKVINDKEELDKVFFVQKPQNTLPAKSPPHDTAIGHLSIHSNTNFTSFSSTSSASTISNAYLTNFTLSSTDPSSFFSTPVNKMSTFNSSFQSYPSNSFSNSTYTTFTTTPATTNLLLEPPENSHLNCTQSIHQTFHPQSFSQGALTHTTTAHAFFGNIDSNNNNNIASSAILPQNYVFPFDESLLNNHYMKKNIYNKGSERMHSDTPNNKTTVTNAVTGKSTCSPSNLATTLPPTFTSQLKQSKSVSDLEREGGGVGGRSEAYSRVCGIDYQKSSKSFMSTSSSSSPSKNYALLGSENPPSYSSFNPLLPDSSSFHPSSCLPTHSSGLFSKMIKMGFDSENIKNAMRIFGKDEKKVFFSNF